MHLIMTIGSQLSISNNSSRHSSALLYIVCFVLVRFTSRHNISNRPQTLRRGPSQLDINATDKLGRFVEGAFMRNPMKYSFHNCYS